MNADPEGWSIVAHPSLEDIRLPLDESRDEIRMVYAIGQPATREISLAINKVSLTEASLLYCALSYEWSPPNMDGRPPLTLSTPSGYSLSLKPNLVAFLRHLPYLKSPLGVLNRDFDCPYPLWIDAICINQEDPSERASQVRLMGQIFGRALMVWSWLGPEMSDSARAIKFINSWDPISVNLGLLETELLKTENEANWAAIVRLMSSSYWRRGWVVQELSLGKPGMFVCGTSMGFVASFSMLVMTAILALQRLSKSVDSPQIWPNRMNRVSALLPQSLLRWMERYLILRCARISEC